MLLPVTEDHVKRMVAFASLGHDANLQPLLPYLVRWVVVEVVNALRTGTQTEVNGRVLGVLSDMASGFLDDSTHFIEPYVRYLWIVFPFLMRPHPATPLLPQVLSIISHSSLPPRHATLPRALHKQCHTS